MRRIALGLLFVFSMAGLLMADAAKDLSALAPLYLADVAKLQALKVERSAPAAVGVFADYGVWSGSARALVEAVRGTGAPVRVLDRTDLNATGLSGVKLLFLPGGLAPLQWQAAGPLGMGALEKWVRGGGRLVGLCAGAYLVSREVRYDGVTYPYPLALFDGVAEGPVAGLAPYPKVGPVKLTVTPQGSGRGLAPIAAATLAYGGGPRFVGGSNVTVLARYPDGSAALVARRHGAGEVVLTGAHVELSPGQDPWSATPHPQAAALVRALAGPFPR